MIPADISFLTTQDREWAEGKFTSYFKASPLKDNEGKSSLVTNLVLAELHRNTLLAARLRGELSTEEGRAMMSLYNIILKTCRDLHLTVRKDDENEFGL